MSTATTTEIEAARNWLANADHDPDHARRWWSHNPNGIAMMPLGTGFDVIEIPKNMAAIALSPEITGPMFRYVDTGRLYILVPAGTSADWDERHVLCLGRGLYLRVPDPALTELSRMYWLRPPTGSGDLTPAASVQRAVEWVIHLTYDQLHERACIRCGNTENLARAGHLEVNGLSWAVVACPEHMEVTR